MLVAKPRGAPVADCQTNMEESCLMGARRCGLSPRYGANSNSNAAVVVLDLRGLREILRFYDSGCRSTSSASFSSSTSSVRTPPRVSHQVSGSKSQ
jgi:hypothetical protein